MPARGQWPPSRRKPAAAAVRAALAHPRSVSISVGFDGGAGGRASSTLAPARSSEARSSSSARRSRAVEPRETISTSRACAKCTSADGAVGVLGAQRLEAWRALQRDRAYRGGAQHVEACSVALLDRLYGGVLATPGERPDDRETGGDAWHLGSEERQATRHQREH